MKNKAFDCVEMTLRIQEKIGLETQALSPSERRERQRRSVEASSFAERWKAPAKAVPFLVESARQPALTRKKKSFDCVEMKHRIQERIYEQTKEMTPAERMAHMHRRIAEGPFAGFFKPGSGGESRDIGGRQTGGR